MSEQNEQKMPMPWLQTSPFESIRHTDETGDYWTARELMPVLEYTAWQRFEEAIQRAITDYAKSRRDVMVNFSLKANVSATRGPKQRDYLLSRYACRLITMTAQSSGAVAAQARTYFSDRVDDVELLLDPDRAFREWRRRAIASFISHGYSQERAERRIDGITARNALTYEWHVRGITEAEYPILTDRLRMGSFGLTIVEHKELAEFEVTYRGKKPAY
jgi:DNA-damage-inducible protein D